MVTKQDASSFSGNQELMRIGDRKELSYFLGNKFNIDLVIELYSSSGLGKRRPITDRERMIGMLEKSNLVITAWEQDNLIGIARSVSDYGWTTYLSDLAVRDSYQGKGIGRELMRLTREIGGSQTKILLLAAPAAENYYPKCGFSLHPQAWILRSEDELR